ncbi:hypothetical protein CISIN_1g043243mg [Citrus sinensis]|uniref:Uncharacterized protein n=1 Tax=Citrus sinensis TaxID=2711 RepID=A0A067DA73_CITSI|nr:hypothetical protein CISIN_1g043243mg [Citrus sinensis]
MRTTLLLPLSFLLFAFIGKPLPVLGNASLDPVLDIIRKQLRVGSYRGNNKTFLLHVVQEQNILKYGLPMTFSPINPKKGIVRESTDLNIKFEVAKIRFVTTGGVKGNPGPQTMRNWFMIEKFYSDYKLVIYHSHYKKKDLS